MVSCLYASCAGHSSQELVLKHCAAFIDPPTPTTSSPQDWGRNVCNSGKNGQWPSFTNSWSFLTCVHACSIGSVDYNVTPLGAVHRKIQGTFKWFGSYYYRSLFLAGYGSKGGDVACPSPWSRLKYLYLNNWSIALKLFTDSHGPQTMKPNVSGDPLTFHLSPLWVDFWGFC